MSLTMIVNTFRRFFELRVEPVTFEYVERDTENGEVVITKGIPCSKCDAPATLWVKKTIEGDGPSHLCSDCAKVSVGLDVSSREIRLR